MKEIDKAELLASLANLLELPKHTVAYTVVVTHNNLRVTCEYIPEKYLGIPKKEIVH